MQSTFLILFLFYGKKVFFDSYFGNFTKIEKKEKKNVANIPVRATMGTVFL